MAQTWWCDQGDGEPAVVVLSSLEAGQASGHVSTPCLAHWVGLCASVVEAAGCTVTWPQPEAPADPELPGPWTQGTHDLDESDDGGDEQSAAELADVPASPDPMVSKVVRRSGGRRRSSAERGAMHAHLREAEGGD